MEQILEKIQYFVHISHSFSLPNDLAETRVSDRPLKKAAIL